MLIALTQPIKFLNSKMIVMATGGEIGQITTTRARLAKEMLKPTTRLFRLERATCFSRLRPPMLAGTGTPFVATRRLPTMGSERQL